MSEGTVVKTISQDSSFEPSTKFRSGEEEAYYHERVKQLTPYQEKWGSLYPHVYRPGMTFEEFRTKYDNAVAPGEITSETAVLVGRIKTKRAASKKLYFYTMVSDGVEVQFLLNFKMYEDGDHFKETNKILHIGDHIGAQGVVGKSKRGELSLFVTGMKLLAPCYYSLPREQFGLKDVEKRVRDRHVDLLVNPKSRSTFMMADDLLFEIRSYLRENSFREVRTPVLSTKAGGASARPFKSHHNDLDCELQMRIAPELYLKSLIVGGFPRLYEIGPQFRNEGIDTTHNPEFWTLEFYEAYADYHDLMRRTEELLPRLAKKLTGGMKIKYQPLHAKEGDEVEIDFTPPYKRYPVVPTLEAKTGRKFPQIHDNEETVDFLKEVCAEMKIICPPPLTATRLLDRLISELIEPMCVNPSFICEHPLVMSPLAKWHRDDPTLSERFEVFVNGVEVINAYTELNDPVRQEAAFMKQMEARHKGDDEAQEIDEEYVRTLAYGLPPTAGFGAGIERLTMFFSNNNSIRDVILFPVRAPPKVTQDKDLEAKIEAETKTIQNEDGETEVEVPLEAMLISSAPEPEPTKPETQTKSQTLATQSSSC